LKNFKMTIAYDGRRYKGFRKTKQNDDKTIQGKLEMILNKMCEQEIEVIAAVNTDAGVHAKKQVVNFKIEDTKLKPRDIKKYFEEFLPDDIVVIKVEEEEERFHSRYMIKTITYEYRLWKKDAPVRALFERQYVKQMDEMLNIHTMQDAAKLLIGEHDFANFSTKSKANNTIKNMVDLNVSENDNEIIITMKANGFLLNMERIIVGTLVQIGLAQRKKESITEAFNTKKKDVVGHKAMGHALCLTDIEY